jgi:hypothetical protein
MEIANLFDLLEGLPVPVPARRREKTLLSLRVEGRGEGGPRGSRRTPLDVVSYVGSLRLWKLIVPIFCAIFC